MKMKVEYWPVVRLKGYEKNARVHSDDQIAQIAASIREFGFVNPVLVDGDGVLVAGHGRLAAAKSIGITKVPVIRLDHLTEDQSKALRIADNRLPISATWNEELLRIELNELSLAGFDMPLLGFDAPELVDFMTAPLPDGADPEATPEPPKNPVSRRGDLWLLGKHRLLCGDSTRAEDVARVLSEEKPHLMVTDPPYGVRLDPSWRDRAGANTLAKSGNGSEHYMRAGKDDTEARWDDVWKLAPVDVFYVWCAGSRLVDVHDALSDMGFDVRQILIWNKMVLTLTRTNYWWTHEHCLYGVRNGATAHWIGKNGQGTVWDIPSPKHIMSRSTEKNEPHPAQKPLECMRRPIENNSKSGDSVYEPFSGSGTTIIAAEMMKRRCFALEIAPEYIDVAVQRWQAFAQKQAILDGDGRTFDEISAERKRERKNGIRKPASLHTARSSNGLRANGMDAAPKPRRNPARAV